MGDDDGSHDSFEEMIRSIAREIGRSVENVARVDLEEIAGVIGVDPDRARQWIDNAQQWLREHAQNPDEGVSPGGAGRADAVSSVEPLRSAGPSPLDLPTPEQGRALAALDSGRWTVEPGTHALATQGDGPAPSDGLGLVGELRARDWIGAGGEVTTVGRHALSRWLEAADAH